MLSFVIYFLNEIIINTTDGFTGFLNAVANLVIASLPSVVGKTPWWVLAVDMPSPSDKSGEKSSEKGSSKPVKNQILPGEAFLVEGRPTFVLLPPEK